MRIIPPTTETTTQEETIDLSRGCIVFDATNWPFAEFPQVARWGFSDGRVEARIDPLVMGDALGWSTEGNVIGVTIPALKEFFPEAAE